ncbi:MAG: hypothetical protein KDA73_09655 [Rhodobacteraceae bacterium]|nr:hypothetical protein [Paracoccaceae bacterium]
MRRAAHAFVLLALAACTTRPLTGPERDFAATVQGPALDAPAVRVTKGALIAGFPSNRKPRPYATCRERIWPRETAPKVRWSVAGFALDQHLYVAERRWRDDFLAGYPGDLPLADAMFLAHELTHVWQWQHRSATGYSAWRAASEHGTDDDPYLFELTPGKPFLAYGYEQQGALVEEFVCCRALDPNAVRTEQLYDLLSPNFPDLARHSAASKVSLPWTGADTHGICRG